MNLFKNKGFVSFVVKFLLLFAILYCTTLAVIGLSAPDGYYNHFVAKYFDYVSWITNTLLWGTKMMLLIFGIHTYEAAGFGIRIVGGTGVRIAYDCVGYGVMSFWIAFVIATPSKISKKIFWLVFGLLILWLINVSRISLMLVAYNRNWETPLGLDHHTLFNIVAYLAIFIMIYFFDKASKHNSSKNEQKKKSLE